MTRQKFRALILESLEPKRLFASDLSSISLEGDLLAVLNGIPSHELSTPVQSNLDLRLSTIGSKDLAGSGMWDASIDEKEASKRKGSDLADGKVSQLLRTWNNDNSAAYSDGVTRDAAWSDFETRLSARMGSGLPDSSSVRKLGDFVLSPELVHQQLLGAGIREQSFGPQPNAALLGAKNPLQQLIPMEPVVRRPVLLDHSVGSHAFVGMFCTSDGLISGGLIAEGESSPPPIGEGPGTGEPGTGEPGTGEPGSGEPGSGSGGGDSGSTFEVPDFEWPAIVSGSVNDLDFFSPPTTGSFRFVDEYGSFTEEMLPTPDMTLSGVHWVHIIDQVWFAPDNWSFRESLVMSFNVEETYDTGPGESATATRSGHLIFTFEASRGFATSSLFGPTWNLVSNFKDDVTFDFDIGGATTITPGTEGTAPVTVRSGADLLIEDEDPETEPPPTDLQAQSSWSSNANFLTSISGSYQVQSVPSSAPSSGTSNVREITTNGNANMIIDVSLGGAWSSTSQSGNLYPQGAPTLPNTAWTTIPEGSMEPTTAGVEDLTGEGHSSSSSGSFNSGLARKNALDWDLRGVKHDATILDIMGDVKSKLNDELSDQLTDNRFFAWRDTGTTPTGVDWEATLAFGWNLSPEVSATLESEQGVEVFIDVEGDIAADQDEDVLPSARRAASMKYSDYDFLNLSIRGEKFEFSDSDPTNTFDKSWEGELVIAYGLGTTGEGIVDISKAVTDLEVGGSSEIEWSFDGFDFVKVKVDSKDKSFRSDMSFDNPGTYLHSIEKDDYHNFRDQILIKFNGSGDLLSERSTTDDYTISGTGLNKLIKHVDYFEDSQAKVDELNKRWGGYNPDYWSRYIVWDTRTDKFKQTVSHENTFSAATGFTASPEQPPVGDLAPIITGFRKYGANPDGSDLTQAGNPGAINWSIVDIATGAVTTTGPQGSSSGSSVTPETAKTSSWVGWLQAGLDVAGLIPVIGEIADLANAGIYLSQGDYQMASLSAISIIPVVGDAIGKSGKVTLKAVRYMDEVAEAAEQATKKVDIPDVGCFVGETPVHIASLATCPWDIALCSVANEASAEYEFLFGAAISHDFSVATGKLVTPIKQAIADVCIGSRTLGENPIRDNYDWSFEEPDESTWRLIHMQMHRDDGVEVDIQILRPRDWIEAMDFREGAEFEVDLPHTSAHGFARIVAISACPALAAGEGSLVIGKFETRNAKELVKVTMEDDSVITGTRIHPVWSIDRSAWVELGNLEVGETLLGADGPTNVQCLTFLAANQPVYNLEVFGEHVYRVGTSGVLCHNTGDGVCTIVLNPGAPTGDMATEGGLNLFKWNTDQALDAAGWRDGDYFLLLPNQGSFAANWAQNSSRLREVMRNRKPIFDSYVDNAGNLIPTRGFLNAERELLINRRWTFNPTTGAWHPPVAP